MSDHDDDSEAGEPVELSDLARVVVARARDGDPSAQALAALRRSVLANVEPGGGGGGLGTRPRGAWVMPAVALGGVLLAGVVAYVGYEAWRRSPLEVGETAPTAVNAHAPAATAAAPVAPRAAAPSIAPERAAVAPVPARTPPPTAPAEAVYLESIRIALGAEPTRALRLARRHSALYPHGLLGEEAEALEIEALARLGRRDEAEDVAARFEARHPASPYHRRIERALAAP